MQEAANLALWIEIGKLFGPLVMALFVAMHFVRKFMELQAQQKQEDRESQEKKIEADRKEHIQKWNDMVSQAKDMVRQTSLSHQAEIERYVDQSAQTVKSMVDSHRTEMNRQFALHERNSSALEYLGAQVHQMSEAIESNQYCPVVREHTHGK